MSDVLKLTQTLMEIASVTPMDHGCQNIMIQRLRALGFNIESLRFGNVENFWARLGNSGPLFAFAGHTDVVPTGPEQAWQSAPFKPEVRDGYLYGRGAADMKGSLAAMIVATEQFLKTKPLLKGSIGFLITGDEEGDATNGTVKVIETLSQRGEKIDWCLVGEPSSSQQLGDTIKNGRRGSLSGTLRIIGQQGHIAYPQLADNPIHRASEFLRVICVQEWDKGNQYFPATSFQISNINAGTGANNVIPGELTLLFNFRFSTETTAEKLKQTVVDLLTEQGLQYNLQWHLSGHPFLTPEKELVAATRAAIQDILGIDTLLSTSGGTSDGRFIAPTGAQVIELGPVNDTIHKIDERTSIAELEQLTLIYQNILQRLLS
ncbi:MAG: succinyl-diaminopimelate desuccinylase [Gammaproteobacteria bacterium]|nr:succinyl-diaminopimelate desuccinylase [Gammaproteobacteria bacterium]